MASVVAGWLVLVPSATAITVGVNSDITWGVPSSQISHEISLTTAAGVKWIRASVDLSQAAPNSADQLDSAYLAQIDSEVGVARAAGLNVLLEFDRAPYWASADPSKYSDAAGKHWNRYWRYADPRDYGAIVAALARHYSGLGINAFELWNEPNNPSFWPSGPNASQYTELLKASYRAINAADPSATVVLGGLSNKGSYAFLQGMYAAGARGWFDVANFHIYPEGNPTSCLSVNGRPYEGSFCVLDGLRSVMSTYGDRSPVWVSELGWSTCTGSSYCYSQQEQASYLTSAFQMLDQGQYSWVTAAFVYQMRDLYWDTANVDWESSLGLLDRNFAPKPAYAALKAVATREAQKRGLIRVRALAAATARTRVRRKHRPARSHHRRPSSVDSTGDRWHSSTRTKSPHRSISAVHSSPRSRHRRNVRLRRHHGHHRHRLKPRTHR
ncbi:MAG: cellulase family glycosylhydrolase [Solirubrobacteraceae bacterium]